jgi:hypothetical protein
MQEMRREGNIRVRVIAGIMALKPDTATNRYSVGDLLTLNALRRLMQRNKNSLLLTFRPGDLEYSVEADRVKDEDSAYPVISNAWRSTDILLTADMSS